MLGLDLFEIFIDRLDRADICYFVTGAVASIIYGRPRLTHDLDLVIELNRSAVSRLSSAFPEDEFYCPPTEVLTLEARRSLRGHFNLIHYETGFRADVYLMGTDPLHLWAMAQRRVMKVGTGQVWVAPPEYVIVRKLEYYREGGSEKHLEDIAGILELSRDEVNITLLEEKIRQAHLDAEWEVARMRSADE